MVEELIYGNSPGCTVGWIFSTTDKAPMDIWEETVDRADTVRREDVLLLFGVGF
jgi:hypothetical protein